MTAHAASMLSAMQRSVADTDPDVARAIARETARQAHGLELIASENFVSTAVLEAAGFGVHEQVRRGVSGAAVLRRLRAGRRRRVAGDRAGKGVVRRRACQRAASLGRAGEHGGVPRDPEARRHHPRHEPGARRPSDARPSAQLLGQILQRRALRRAAGRRAHRLRRARRACAHAQAEADHRRRERLSARARLRPVPPGGRRGGGAAHDRHGPHRRARRSGRASEPRAPLGFRHDDDAQDASGPARRPGALPRAFRQGAGSGALPRRAGRPARAHRCGQGGVPQGSRRTALRHLSAAGGRPTPRGSRRGCRPGGSGW